MKSLRSEVLGWGGKGKFLITKVIISCAFPEFKTKVPCVLAVISKPQYVRGPQDHFEAQWFTRRTHGTQKGCCTHGYSDRIQIKSAKGKGKWGQSAGESRPKLPGILFYWVAQTHWFSQQRCSPHMPRVAKQGSSSEPGVQPELLLRVSPARNATATWLASAPQTRQNR